MNTMRCLVGTGLLLSLVIIAAGCGPSGGNGKSRSEGAGKARAESLESARQMFLAGSDRANNNLAILQLNNHLNQHPEQRATLTDTQRALLQSRFGLDKAELDEVANPNYTTLDAAYLESCFLMRDALRALDLDALSPAEKAGAAFAWAMRQVALRQHDGSVTPPDFVLRRGWGSARERAAVYLALVQQLGLPAGLVASPGLDEPWACGVVVEREGTKEWQLLLFDHRLGLPLPGEKGPTDSPLARAYRLAMPVPQAAEGIPVATLAAVRQKPELLADLKADEKTTYDVTADHLKAATVELAVPLSALAPRHRILQNELLTPALRATLWVDPEAQMQALGAATGAEGGPATVKVRREMVGLLRDFLPERDGGIGTDLRMAEFLRTIVPRDSLPPQVQQLDGEPRNLFEQRFALPFVALFLERNGPRDLVLRGRTKEASEALTVALDQANLVLSVRKVTPDVEEEFGRWREEITQAYGNLIRAQAEAKRGGPADAVEAARAQIDQVWKNHAKGLMILIEGAAAGPRRFFLMYLLAQAKYEQAERAASASEGEAAAAKGGAATAWKESAGWCESFIQEYPHSVFTPTSRLMLARARAALGQAPQARTLTSQLSAQPSRWEQVAHAYLARHYPK